MYDNDWIILSKHLSTNVQQTSFYDHKFSFEIFQIRRKITNVVEGVVVSLACQSQQIAICGYPSEITLTVIHGWMDDNVGLCRESIIRFLANIVL